MRNIILTGVSKGLGLEISKELLREDYTVYGLSRSSSNEFQELIKSYPDNMKWLSYDLQDPKSIRDEVFKKWIGFDTPIHGFINNAALAYDDIVTNLNINKLSEMYQVNVFSPMNISKYVLRHFLLHKVQGSIVHLSSISVHTGYKGLAMYASTKGALEAFSKNTAREWGSVGIRSNCIVAGFMETNMSKSLNSDQKNRIYNRTSLKKPTELISVANTCLYLLSDMSSSITGQNIFVDSGTI